MFEENNALIFIDIQNDFCPGGALAVDDGDKIIEISNKLQEKFKINIITQDWHPPFHKSFASNHLNNFNISHGKLDRISPYKDILSLLNDHDLTTPLHTLKTGHFIFD